MTDANHEVLMKISSLEKTSKIAIPFAIVGMIAITGAIYFASTELKQTTEELSKAEQKLQKVRAETALLISKTQNDLEKVNKTLENSALANRGAPSNRELKYALTQLSVVDTSLSVANAKVAIETSPNSTVKYGAYSIDVFYCTDEDNSGISAANNLLTLKEGNSTGRWRIRELSKIVNATEGYRIASNLIRFNPDERNIAQLLKNDIEAKMGETFNLQEIAYPTPNYVSVFVCKPNQRRAQ